MSLIRRSTAVIICLALLAVILVLVLAILQANRLDNTAQELAIAATQEAFETEYPTTLIENSHPDYQAIIPPQELLRYIESAKRRLGPLKSIAAIRGSAELSGGQAASSAEFELDLDFQNSPASVNIGMETVDERWLITAFRLSAELLRN